MPETPDTTPMALWAMGERGTNRLRKLLGAYVIANSTFSVAKRSLTKLSGELAYTVAVASNDDIYPDVHRWLLDSLPARRRRALLAKTSRRNDVDESSETSELRMFYDGSRSQVLHLDGCRVRVNVERPDSSKSPSSDEGAAMRWLAERERIVFTARTLAARDAVVKFLDEITASKAKAPPRLYVAGRYGGWTRAVVPLRQLESVVLSRGQKELLVDDLASFLAREQDYSRLGIPYHRGYLLHGPPGTGKTSMAKALANEFHLDVYYIALPAVPSDTHLIDLLTGVEPRSMLLLEDIDIVHGSRERDDSQPGVTLSGLLNGLDGFLTPHGLITVMTTNRREVLDPALVRPGRVDLDLRIGSVDDAQFRELARMLMGVEIGNDVKVKRPLMPADIVEVAKQWLGRTDSPLWPEVAVSELKGLAEEGSRLP